jgi:hypothetical protein
MAAANAAAAEAAANDADMDVEEEGAAGGDKGLLEATGTTDGTHISAAAQPRGSDGDRWVLRGYIGFDSAAATAVRHTTHRTLSCRCLTG